MDCFGLVETNTAWQHYYLQLQYRECVQRQFRIGKTEFGFPSHTEDPSSEKETFQTGGCLTTVQGRTATTVQGQGIVDPTGLGRWSGVTLEGKGRNALSIVTAYRVCEGSIRQAPIGSALVREHEFYRNKGEQSPQPRQRILSELRRLIDHLQNKGHTILVMLDANGTLENDKAFQDFRDFCGLVDLHRKDPAPSTYIGSNTRRIDYMLGCQRVAEAISRQGSLAYNEGPQSDHRGLFVDLDIEQLLGSNSTQLIERSKTRLLHSGNPEQVSTYLEGMRRYYEDHRMVERILQLHATHATMTHLQVRQQLTAWDNDQGRAMKHAELQLSAPARQYQWSPKLRKSGVILRYWKLRLREIKYAEEYSDTFNRWEAQIKEYDATFELPEKRTRLTLEDIRVRLNSATKQLKKIQKQAMSHRQQSFQDLLSTYEDDKNPRTSKESQCRAKIVKRTLLSESCRRLFGNIRSIVKLGEYGPLNNIRVPREANSISGSTQPGNVHSILRNVEHSEMMWDTIITQEEMEQHLILFNREAFRAAATSPCGHGIIHDALTFISLSQEAEDLLKGIVPQEWHGDDQLLREFLASFVIPNTIQEKDPINISITSDDISKGFKGWKETTSTSPLGRHLGHYKALIQDPVMLDCLAKFLDIAITRGISIPRWQQAVNVMIEKDKGDPKINRLRIIHLFEADYNLFLKLMWGSRLVRRAVHMDLLHDGQHGSTPGKTTMDPIMLTQLTADMCRLLKINYARFDNDASACFDRIIVALGMLAARRCGMTISAIQAHAKSLELMKYMVKTVYGVSESSYQGTPFEPLFGTGQGSGASPAVWLSILDWWMRLLMILGWDSQMMGRSRSMTWYNTWKRWHKHGRNSCSIQEER